MPLARVPPRHVRRGAWSLRRPWLRRTRGGRRHPVLDCADDTAPWRPGVLDRRGQPRPHSPRRHERRLGRPAPCRLLRRAAPPSRRAAIALQAARRAAGVGPLEDRWDARGRKLRGVSKPVFEARQDDGDRVLFTLARSARPNGAAGLATFVQVWDLVPHDRVERAARRINDPPRRNSWITRRSVGGNRRAAAPARRIVRRHPRRGAGGDRRGARADAAAGRLRPRDREEIAGGVRWYVLRPGSWWRTATGRRSSIAEARSWSSS